MKKTQKNAVAQTIKLETLASWSDFSERHLRDLSTAGSLPPVVRGELPYEAVAALFRYLRRDSEELIREKLKKTIADRRIAEIEARRAEGKFKSVEIFNNHLIAMGAAINRALNEGEKILKKGGTPEAVMDAVRALVVKALAEAQETDGDETCAG